MVLLPVVRKIARNIVNLDLAMINGVGGIIGLMIATVTRVDVTMVGCARLKGPMVLKMKVM